MAHFPCLSGIITNLFFALFIGDILLEIQINHKVNEYNQPTVNL